jgi:SsrA-binding protein
MELIFKNKKAYFEYSVIEEYDAGIVLHGSEVKSIRMCHISLSDSFIYIKDGEIWLKNLKVSKYKQMHPMEIFDGARDKKLLLNRREINKIGRYLMDKGVTCVPLLIFTKNNKIKVKIGIVKGKKLYDKKNTIKERDIDINIKRELGF